MEVDFVIYTALPDVHNSVDTQRSKALFCLVVTLHRANLKCLLFISV